MANIYTQLASDTFHRANETPLFGGGNWDITVNGGLGNNLTLVLFSNTCFLRKTSFNTGQFWAAASVVFQADQYTEVLLSVLPTASGQYIGALCRGANDGNAHLNGYAFSVVKTGASTQEYRIQKFTSTVPTTIATLTGAPTPVIGDVIRLEVQGTTLTGFYNGVKQLQVTDSTYALGQPGIVMFGTANTRPGTKSWDAGSITLPPQKFNSATFANFPASANPGDLWYATDLKELFMAVVNPNQYFPDVSDAQNVTRIWEMGLNVIIGLRAAVPSAAPTYNIYLTTDTLEAFAGTGLSVQPFRLDVTRALRGSAKASRAGQPSNIPAAVYYVALDEG